MSTDATATRLELIQAFNGDGVPDKALPPHDKQAAADYFGELAYVYFGQLPRAVRRMPQKDRDLLLDLLIRALSHGFFAGATWVVERDRRG